jgi:hypothetical protein
MNRDFARLVYAPPPRHPILRDIISNSLFVVCGDRTDP